MRNRPMSKNDRNNPLSDLFLIRPNTLSVQDLKRLAASLNMLCNRLSVLQSVLDAGQNADQRIEIIAASYPSADSDAIIPDLSAHSPHDQHVLMLLRYAMANQ